MTLFSATNIPLGDKEPTEGKPKYLLLGLFVVALAVATAIWLRRLRW